MPRGHLDQHAYGQMLDKLRSSDPDFRCMALIDFQKDVKPYLPPPISNPTSTSSTHPTSHNHHSHSHSTYRIDEPVEKEFFREVIKLCLEDGVSEVRNLGVGCLSTLTKISTRPGNVITTLDTLLRSTTVETEEEVRDVAVTALKGVVAELKENVVAEGLNRVVAGITKQVQNPQIPTQHAVELLDILNLIFHLYPSTITTHPTHQSTSLTILLSLLTSSRSSLIRKRAILTLSSLAPIANAEIFTTLGKRIIGVLGGVGVQGMEEDDDNVGGGSGGEGVKKNAYALLVGQLAKTSAGKMGAEGLVEEVVGGILELSESLEDEEALETSMTTLETLVVRCPTEVTPFLTQITTRATTLLRYDPNYADSDGDEDMDDGEEEDEDYDDDFEEQYSDDEDASWKARRSAAKLLQALISTRPESLNDWYSNVGPLLTSRLSEREESVRAEVFNTWEILLRQTALYGGSGRVSAGETPMGLKRKRIDSGEQQASTSSPLDAHLLSLTKAILKQASNKSQVTKEKAFGLLKSVATQAPGCLDTQSSIVIGSVQKSFASISAAGANASNLILATLSFLGAFFKTHPSRTYADSLPQLATFIIKYMGDKYQKISLEALETAGSLAKGLKPFQSSTPLPPNYAPPILSIFETVCSILKSNTADADTKDKALYTIADLFVLDGSLLGSSGEESLDLVAGRLAADSNQVAALAAVGAIADNVSGKAIDKWLYSVLEQLPALYRRCQKQNRAKALALLNTLVNRFGTNVSTDVAGNIIRDLKSYISTSDLHNLDSTFGSVALLLRTQPSLRSTVDAELMDEIKRIINSPLLHTAAIRGLQQFFATYISLEPDLAPGLITELAATLDLSKTIPTPDEGGSQGFATVAKCIGTIAENSQFAVSNILTAFTQAIDPKTKDSSDARKYLALLVLGEIGRTNDFAKVGPVFDNVLRLFEATSEEVKSAAAFAAGNIAVGNTSAYLPVIVQGVAGESKPATRLLYLHGLKEAIVHCSDEQIQKVADTLWEPLLANEASDKTDDGARNVKAACIGKLAVSRPEKYIPDLRNRIGRSTPTVKAIIAASTRYTLTETNAACDQVLAPALFDFLSLMQDGDYIVRRLAVQSLNAAAQYKTGLIANQLPALMKMVYAETVERKELIREFTMGPFTVKIDEGLGNRKAAFEAMNTLINTSLSRLNINELVDVVIRGLGDSDEVRLLAWSILSQLGSLAENLIQPRLDEAAEPAVDMMKQVVTGKDDTPQDVQRKEEAQKTAIQYIVPLAAVSSATVTPKFDEVMKGLATNDKWREYFTA